MRSKANSYLVSAGLTLNLFWILNLTKTAHAGFKGVLNFFPPVGPLLGVYLICTVWFVVFVFLLRSMSFKDSAKVYWFYVISAILFLVMVFPPVFEPIAHAIGG